MFCTGLVDDNGLKIWGITFLYYYLCWVYYVYVLDIELLDRGDKTRRWWGEEIPLAICEVYVGVVEIVTKRGFWSW